MKEEQTMYNMAALGSTASSSVRLGHAYISASLTVLHVSSG